MQIITIRSRGQITIPEKLRKYFEWLNPGSAVVVTHEEDEIRIKPLTSKENINWNKIWDLIAVARSFKGKKGNLSEFVSMDRQNH